MLNPKLILDDIQLKLQAIPELAGARVEIYDAESAIYRSVYEALDNLQAYGQSILIVWDGAAAPRTGETRGWSHNISLHLLCQRLDGDAPAGYFDLMQKIVDGVPAAPAGDGYWRFIESELVEGQIDPIADFTISTERNRDGVEHQVIRFTAVEKQ